MITIAVKKTDVFHRKTANRIRKGEYTPCIQWKIIEAVDVEIAQAIKDEFARQSSHIELIASEKLGKSRSDVSNGQCPDK